MSVHYAACSVPDRARPKVTERVAGCSCGGIEFSTSRAHRGVLLIAVAGEVDLCTAPRLREKILRAFGSREFAAENHTMVVDLSLVTFFAAAGVTALVEALAEAEKCGRRLVLITTVRCVDRVIEITGLATRFHRVGSLGAALAAAEAEPRARLAAESASLT